MKTTYRIETISGIGLPVNVSSVGYDTEAAAEAMAEDAHQGEWRAVPEETEERHIYLDADGMERWCSDDEYADDYRRSVRRQALRRAAASGRTVEILAPDGTVLDAVG